MSKSPAFQFYPADYLADANVQMMTLEQEGIYIRLMCYCWREGSIPADEESLARLVSKNCALTDLRVVAKCFVPSGNRLVHVRLEAEREKQDEWRRKSSEGGVKSAEKRRAAAKARIVSEGSELKGGCGLVDTKSQPKGNSSSSISSTNNDLSITARQKRKITKYTTFSESDFEFPAAWPPEAREFVRRWVDYKATAGTAKMLVSYQAEVESFASDARQYARLVKRAISEGWAGLNAKLPLDSKPPNGTAATGSASGSVPRMTAGQRRSQIAQETYLKFKQQEALEEADAKTIEI